jgi:hypothetical protein
VLGPAEWAVSAGPTILNAPLELRSLNSRRPARDQSDFVASQNGPFAGKSKANLTIAVAWSFGLSKGNAAIAVRIPVLASVCRINALWRLRLRGGGL